MKRTTSLKELILRTRTTWRRLVITWSSIVFITIIYIILLQALILPLLLISIFDAMVKWICLLGLFLCSVLPLFRGYLDTKYRGLYRRGIVVDSKHLRGLDIDRWKKNDQSAVSRHAVGSFVAASFCIAQMFIYVVFTVFYYECRKSHGEKVEIESEEGHGLLTNQVSNV
ncbi:hypothetical protein Syun_025004 [Stephania yunnanensis]|uniref:Uncharacterized protein n=1 Tax=Stephania yunnanensis TaxID=152371 RepID=A0AAP0EZN3_9MAGN